MTTWRLEFSVFAGGTQADADGLRVSGYRSGNNVSSLNEEERACGAMRRSDLCTAGLPIWTARASRPSADRRSA